MPGLFLAFISVQLAADELDDIDNYLQYSPSFSSSGQPSAEQFKALSEAGFKRVIYIAFTDNKTAIESEDRVVKSLAMDYVHIPVDFDQPTLDDFEDFACGNEPEWRYPHIAALPDQPAGIRLQFSLSGHIWRGGHVGCKVRP